MRTFTKQKMKANRILWLIYSLICNVIIGCLPIWAIAQNSNELYYLFPIKPGEANSLSGTMGELRNNHFHGGLDIRTDSRTGLPVYAAAEGYVSRIKVQAVGYGHALYIKHPNGTTTVYAHLDAFIEPIAEYVRKIQYQRESFEVDLYLTPKQFYFRKGEQIAFSGNSGSSGGPHLHFEIRDASDAPINPMIYPFAEIKDRIPPIAEFLAVAPLTPQARVEGKHERETYNLRLIEGVYQNTQPIHAIGEIGIAGLVYDRMDGSYFKYGIQKTEVFLNDTIILECEVDRVPFHKGRMLNLFIDYDYYIRKGKRMQQFYIAEGNQLALYKTAINKGRIRVEAGKTYNLKIIIYDAKGNKSMIQSQIIGKDAPPQTTYYHKGKDSYSWSIVGHALKIESYKTENASGVAKFHIEWRTQEVAPAYTEGQRTVFIWDLRKGLPDSVYLPNNEKIVLPLCISVPAQKDFSYYADWFNVYIPRNALYDVWYLTAFRQNDYYYIGHISTPLHTSINIKIKDTDIPEAKKPKTRIYSVTSYGGLLYEGGKWESDGFKFSTRTLGAFKFLTDEEPPIARFVRRSPSSVQCIIYDKRSGIDTYRATLNGKFLMMKYDPKKKLLIAEPEIKGSLMKGKLELEVTDKVGNKTKIQTVI
ncbi:MAG: M23 family metallopeptidase [Bernardetiaceae bacterium]|nr:M23 family metallopeptidase [Bernardetiaceae bacterium]